MNLSNTQIWAIVIYLIVSLIFALLAAWGIFRLGRRAFRLITNPSGGFGVNVKARLLGLTVAVFALPTVLPSLFRVFLSSMGRVVTGIGDQYQTLGTNLHEACGGSGPEADCFGKIAGGLIQGITEVLNGILSDLQAVPFNRLVCFLAIWALVSFLLDDSAAPSGPSERGLSSLRKIYINRDRPIVRNAVFFGILGFSAYLSMAAILAIPELEEKNVAYQEIGIEKLKVQLNDAANSLNDFKAKFEIPAIKEVEDKLAKLAVKQPERTTEKGTTALPLNTNTEIALNTSSNANGNLANTLTNSNTGPTGGSVNSTRSNAGAQEVKAPDFTEEDLSYIKSYFAGDQSRTADLIAKYEGFLQRAKNQQNAERQNAQQNYELGSIVGKGNKERVKYFLNVTNWFNQQASRRNQYVSDCFRAVQDVDKSWQRFSAALSRNRDSAEDILDQLEVVSLSIEAADRGCSYSVDDEKVLATGQMPERLKLGEGSDLGIFYFFAFWLLKTESLSFALITGLLGFGLLGSACSTFIRERTETRALQRLTQVASHENGVLVNDLTEVVVRGVAAAIVVFLAMVGGLAIFSTGNGQPNSYVILLTCLVAAVFSEAIWKRVQIELDNRLSQRLGGDGSSGDSHGNDEKHIVVEPSTGNVEGGEKLEIRNSGLASVKTVRFGSVPGVDPTIDESGVITVTTPPHKAGNVTIVIEPEEGEKAKVGFRFGAR